MNAGDEKATGGCLCGDIRYEFDHPPHSTGYCHCRMCQKSLGNPFGAALILKKGQVRFVSGSPAWYESSDRAQRGFCGRCGSPVAYRRLDTDDFVIWVGTLDEPDNFQPHNHWWTESRIAWGDVHPGLADGTGDLPSYKAATGAVAGK